MVDQYYSTTLPQLLQELDDVYHDVSAVVAETIIQGADVISMKVRKLVWIPLFQQHLDWSDILFFENNIMSKIFY